MRMLVEESSSEPFGVSGDGSRCNRRTLRLRHTGLALPSRCPRLASFQYHEDDDGGCQGPAGPVCRSRSVLRLHLLLINTVSLLAVRKFVLDPLGLFFTPSTEFLQQGQKLFFPSLIVFAAVWVLIAFRDQDRMSLDRSSQKF